MITCNNQDDISNTQLKRFFSDSNEDFFYKWLDWSAEKGLERLVFQVSRNPKNLQAHLERIYYCFQEHLNEQLFGALVDLLMVLNKKGLALGKRMIAGSQSKLTQNQVSALLNYLGNNSASGENLSVNRYSIFATGVQSTLVLVQLAQDSAEEEQDPLMLAQDFIEFSQLDNAINVLEKAILVEPGRMELHEELLSLFRSTRNQAEFSRFYGELSTKRLPFPPSWMQLNDYFIGLSNAKK
jgi:hypothetical protein